MIKLTVAQRRDVAPLFCVLAVLLKENKNVVLYRYIKTNVVLYRLR